MSSQPSSDEQPSGLVNSAISSRDELYEPRLVSLTELENASNNFPDCEVKDLLSSRYSISLSPALIKISKHSPLLLGKRVENYRPRTEIKEWSNKSRSAMIARLATLDYSPLLTVFNKPPLMITLTYPKNWEALVPTSGAAKQHLQNFKKRYERKFKVPLYGLWKMEFQRRKAVHFHIFCSPPLRGADFNCWLSKTWTEIVNEVEPTEREKHLASGTGVDVALGYRATDNKSISSYFSKHSAPASPAKEYQNQPPDLWLTNGASVGRFWGYWHLNPLIVETVITEDVAIFISRTLRRWHKSKSRPVKVFVWRVDTKTGEVRKRKTTRRIKRFSRTSGYLVVGDGSAIGLALSEAISARFAPTV